MRTHQHTAQHLPLTVNDPLSPEDYRMQYEIIKCISFILCYMPDDQKQFLIQNRYKGLKQMSKEWGKERVNSYSKVYHLKSEAWSYLIHQILKTLHLNFKDIDIPQLFIAFDIACEKASIDKQTN